MLLISRRKDESIMINGNIEVKVIETKSGRVKLGIEFPEGNSVYRKEVFLKIQEENKGSVNINPGSLGQIISKMEKKS